ncbi:hypothetical protein RHSIM_Rhsim09G0095400 [Rhododendron simsii]|uniref:Uncharacterized protein n=1 Tax=Rhododendron simsii TaxID=118357 RepID=A0A834GG48_RHOSS|nr:hypothetical protein RHSIM_Rhsim09G0095400 [Rhododendron simsii]
MLLSFGQDGFHGEAMHILKYVVNQSDLQILRNVTESLLQAKTLNVAQVFLPSNVKDEIDKLNEDLNTACCADMLSQKTSRTVLSILGHKHATNIFVVRLWLLIAVTFILCGGFASTQEKVILMFFSAISNTCMAMGEWVDTSQAETTLSISFHVLTKEPQTGPSLRANNPRYYNQSGRSMPPLCYPYDGQLQVRQCTSFEMSMANASLIWLNFTCKVSGSGLCTSVGWVTPDMYGQLVAAINTVNAALARILVRVMLCVALWLLYANRSQRGEG